ncbi:hypothetical protein QZN11_10570 [Streptomyces gramineus]|uniref:hypothetical protein n=1 Tax=Streptomyces gramineus TaxID=910542 RepID=UPI00398B4165
MVGVPATPDERNGYLMADMVRRLTGWGAAVAAGLLVTGMGVLPAQAEPAAVSTSAAVHCGKPVLKVWYDRDQFGTYLKVWFQTDGGCPKGRKVSNLGGKIHCFEPHAKLLYHESVVNKKAPTETITKAMPPKNKCKSFYAESTIVYKVGGARPAYKDSWRWNWGEYPA